MSFAVVFGAGFIGKHVALALRESGFQVKIVRRTSKPDLDAELKKNEICIIEGDISDPSKYADVLVGASVVIDATKGNIKGSLVLLEAVEKTVNKPKTTRFIWTSGILVHGDNPGKIVTEASPIQPLHEFAKARYEMELRVLSSSLVTGVVVRPGYVYGLEGGFLGQMLWGKFKESGKFVIAGNPIQRWSYVHVKDLARAYAKIASSPKSIVDGEVFLITDLSRPTREEVWNQAAKIAGYIDPIERTPNGGTSAELFQDVTIICDPSKAMKTLKWIPKRSDFIENMALYFEAWKAHNN